MEGSVLKLKLSKLLFFSCGFLLLQDTFVFASKPTRIGIIGGGIGGTSVSYFLSELLPDAEIDLFEKTGLLGGRLNITTIFGNGYETGGSVIHSKNKYAVDLARKFGLDQRWDSGEAMSIVKGDEFVFNTSKWTIVTIFKVLTRYGFDMNRLDSLVGNIIGKFIGIYKLQQNGHAFQNPEELLMTVDPMLVNLTRSDFRTFLKDQGLGELIIDELIQAIMFVNYGQDLSIHSFVGSVSAAGADSSLWSISKGNKLLPEALFKNSKGKLHLNTEINSIVRNSDGKTYTLLSGQKTLGTFDHIVLALPLDAMAEKNRIQFTGFDVNKQPYDFPSSRKYHRTVTTIVAGHVHPKYKHISHIISCEPNWYNSFSLVHPTILLVSEKYPIYKIFSSKPLTDQQLDSIFTERVHKEIHDWLAYPEYNQIPPKFPSFVLAPHLYYLNAIEWAASAMEMSLISGKNIALLIAQDQNKI